MNELIRTSWFVLLPILVLSVLAMALILERGGYFLRIRFRSPELLRQALSRLNRLPAEQLLASFHKNDRSPARVLLSWALSTRIRVLPQFYKQRLESLRDRSLDKMERRLALLPGIGNIATLLGLFGTVSGMITAFSKMQESGSADPYVLAGGISRALVTTAAGLVVAIVTLGSHHFFENLVDHHEEKMEEVITACLMRTGGKNGKERESKRA